MSSDMHDLLSRMADELDNYRQLLTDDRREVHALATEARAALSRWGRPAAPHASPEGEGPSDDQLDLVVIAIQALTPHQPDATTHDLHAVDRGREILRQSLARWGLPAAPPAPLEGEVGELVAALRSTADGLESQAYPQTAALITRAATLLEQLSAAAPAVVPVAVSKALIKAECALAPQPVPVAERLPGPGDCTPQGWCWVLYRGFSTWTLEPPLGQDGQPTGWTHWLPAHAIPLPAPQGGEVEA